jgi:hypothetical protein
MAVIRRSTALTLSLALACLASAAPVPARAGKGPCTAAAKASMPEGPSHDHKSINQHRFACRMEQVAFLPLTRELGAQPDSVLFAMDVKRGIAVVGTAYPEAGFLLFDVADPARPRFLSWYRSAKCDQTLIDYNCGAYVELSSDARTVFLALQNFTAIPGGFPPAPNASPTAMPG